LNILVVAHFQNDSTPTAIFIHNQLLELKKQGLNILVLAGISRHRVDYYGARLLPEIRKGNVDGIEHIFFRFTSLSGYGMWGINASNAIRVIEKSLKQDIKEFAPEIVHAHTIGFDSEIGGWIKKVFGIPLVVTIHGGDAEVPIQKGKGLLLQEWCNRADRIVTVSTKLEKKLEENGIQCKTITILNGYKKGDDRMFHKKKHSVIQVGNLIELKHYETTIQAFQKYQEIYEDARFYIIGQGKEEAKLRKLCNHLKIADKVEFLGSQSNDKVLEKMGECEYFIMPSSPEGFGIAYLEAMSSGCITMGTKGEGIADLIQDKENGFLVSVDGVDEIVKNLFWCEENPPEAELIKEKAYKSVEHLSWENNALKYIQLYGSLVERDENDRN
jgi:teichuronic acid biosynthesis glycosyltransferase TuaC